eukprot:TRINITY_DN2292_c3_g1_i2.p1 TRINITY_DN2292_c3_g1~~TRINITY_DN2292_c3_g1_i2.p1  ORF type:complete len:121 (+),score=6.07 TRINITY_DN2292_c3_g1_i2:636-998(+)
MRGTQEWMGGTGWGRVFLLLLLLLLSLRKSSPDVQQSSLFDALLLSIALAGTMSSLSAVQLPNFLGYFVRDSVWMCFFLFFFPLFLFFLFPPPLELFCFSFYLKYLIAKEWGGENKNSKQ